MPERLNRSTPPRELDLYTQLVILFGGIYAIFGWIFFGFGMIFFWAFAMNSTIVTWFSFGGGEWNNGIGEVQAIHETSFSENETDVYKIRYTFKVGELDYYGTSYATGTNLKVGESVNVEFRENNPKRSRIQGLRSKPFGGWIFFLIILFPLVGIWCIYYSLNQNLKSINLLKNGRFSLGTMVSKVDTYGSVTINEENFPIYKYEFEFDAYGRKHIAKCRTHLAHLVEDDDKEVILYDPYDPNYAIVFDAVENAPELDGFGNLSPASPKKAWVLIAPIVTIIGHGLTAFVWFFT